jgi:ATP-dependent helicase/nuclease subunit A
MSDAQKRAAAPETSAWVAAAAGTGKTRVLRDRVLRLMLAGTAPGRILCLTYTKAAAAEMANRINDALAGWVVMEDDALAADLAGLGVTAPDADALAAARRLFADVLDTPGGMKIQTIHAFCQSVLARFPLEAEMAPHFTLMEDNTGRALERDALDAVLAEAAATPQPALNEAIDHLARVKEWRGAGGA